MGTRNVKSLIRESLIIHKLNGSRVLRHQPHWMLGAECGFYAARKLESLVTRLVTPLTTTYDDDHRRKFGMARCGKWVTLVERKVGRLP